MEEIWKADWQGQERGFGRVDVEILGSEWRERLTLSQRIGACLWSRARSGVPYECVVALQGRSNGLGGKRAGLGIRPGLPGERLESC